LVVVVVVVDGDGGGGALVYFAFCLFVLGFRVVFLGKGRGYFGLFFPSFVSSILFFICFGRYSCLMLVTVTVVVVYVCLCLFV